VTLCHREGRRLLRHKVAGGREKGKRQKDESVLIDIWLYQVQIMWLLWNLP